MNKSTAVVCIVALLVVAWGITLLFFAPNPFAQTSGEYRLSWTDVTVNIPTGNLLGSSTSAAPPTSAAALAPQGNSSAAPSNSTIPNNTIYIHVGNVTAILTGQNWDLVVTRIINSIGPYLLAYAFSSHSSYSYPDSPSALLFNIVGAVFIAVLALLALALLARNGKEIETYLRVSGSRMKRGLARLNERKSVGQ